MRSLTRTASSACVARRVLSFTSTFEMSHSTLRARPAPELTGTHCGRPSVEANRAADLAAAGSAGEPTDRGRLARAE
jgi:hypothetical protein